MSEVTVKQSSVATAMNAAKLKKMEEQVRIGGKGMPRRKRKHVQHSVAIDEKKLQTTLQKLPLTPMTSVEEVKMIMSDGTVKQFKHPKAQSSVMNNLYVLSGTSVDIKLAEPSERPLQAQTEMQEKNDLEDQDDAKKMKIIETAELEAVNSSDDDDQADDMNLVQLLPEMERVTISLVEPEPAQADASDETSDKSSSVKHPKAQGSERNNLYVLSGTSVDIKLDELTEQLMHDRVETQEKIDLKDQDDAYKMNNIETELEALSSNDDQAADMDRTGLVPLMESMSINLVKQEPCNWQPAQPDDIDEAPNESNSSLLSSSDSDETIVGDNQSLSGLETDEEYQDALCYQDQDDDEDAEHGYITANEYEELESLSID